MWHEGYTSEVEYTSHYYHELSPERLRLSLLNAGIEHSIGRDPVYLELGFGQGLSLAIHAATGSGRFYGTDFNPAQVANARDLAAASGRAVGLFEDSFEELAARTDLPEFDIIALHGIWSWVSDESRAAIVDLARRKLKPGGALFVSYNALPGWGSLMPLRTLMAEYAQRQAGGALLDRVEAAVSFVSRMEEGQCAFFAQNPRVKAHLENVRAHDRRYLAHEYFNADWHPMPVTRVADQLAEAKLGFATSATILETLQSINAPAAALPVLAAIADPVMRELTRDFYVNKMFRRDIFVKGARAMAPWDRARRMEQSRFALLGDPAKCPKKVKGAIGEADLHADIYPPLVAALAKAPQCTASVAQLVAAVPGLRREQVWEAMVLLSAMVYVAPVSTSSNPGADETAARALNKALLARAEAGVGVNHLAAPRIGAGIGISMIEQMMMRALKAGDKNPVETVRVQLANIGQQLAIDGRAIADEEESRRELERLFNAFRAGKEEVLKRVGAW